MSIHIFFLLLLVRAFIPGDIQAIIIGSDFASKIIDFIPIRKVSIYPSFLKGFDFDQSNTEIMSIGISYETTIANTFPTILFFLLIILIHILTCLIKSQLSRARGNTNCCIKVAIWTIDMIFKILTFSFYIRNALEMSQFILISSINEIFNYNIESHMRLISFIYAILVIGAYIFLFVLIQYLIFSSYRLNENQHNKLGEFFSGLKGDKKPRFYVTLLLLRRFTFILLVILLSSIPSRAIIGILLAIQLVYMGCIIHLRPYKETRGNIIEILNEIYFTLLISIFLVFNEESNWSSIKTQICMWLLTSNTLASFVIVVVDSTRMLIKWIYKRCQRDRNNNKKIIQIVPSQSTRPLSTTDVHQGIVNEEYKSSFSTPSLNQLHEENKSDLSDNPSKVEDMRKLCNQIGCY